METAVTGRRSAGWDAQGCRILVDVGDVLVATCPRRRAVELARAGVPDWVVPVAAEALGPQFESGWMTEAEFLRHLRGLAGETCAVERLRRAWAQLVGDLNTELVDELLLAKDSVLVSNTNPIDWSIADHHLQQRGYMPPALLSFDHGIRKPHRHFFELAHTAVRPIPAAALLFIDDQAANAAAASAYGFRAHLHTDNKSTIDAIATHRRLADN